MVEGKSQENRSGCSTCVVLLEQNDGIDWNGSGDGETAKGRIGLSVGQKSGWNRLSRRAQDLGIDFYSDGFLVSRAVEDFSVRLWDICG